MARASLFTVLVGFALAAAPARAGGIFQFDELGNLAFSLNGGPFTPLASGTLEFDPTGGVNGDVLVYDLTSELASFQLLAGDVPIGSGSGLVADLRFTDPAGQISGTENCGPVDCLMIYYVFDSNGLPADVGNISTSFLTTQTPLATLSTNTFSYSFSYNAGVLTYDGTIVPEPTTMVMVLCGMAAMACLRKRSRSE